MKATKNRIIALWRVLTSHNFILVEVGEKNEAIHSRNVRVLQRTDFSNEDDLLSLGGAIKIVNRRCNAQEKLTISKNEVVVNGISYTREEFNELAKQFEKDGGR